jgi:hypothetical protein
MREVRSAINLLKPKAHFSKLSLLVTDKTRKFGFILKVYEGLLFQCESVAIEFGLAFPRLAPRTSIYPSG